MLMCAVDKATIDAVIADPPLILRLLEPEDTEAYAKARSEALPWWRRLFGREGSSTLDAKPVGPVLDEGDLDKAWHGVHFLLTGTDGAGGAPLDFLVAGGVQVGSIDVGYGPARAFAPLKVKEILDALKKFDESALRRRFDPAVMMKLKIYPEIWASDAGDDDAFAYCVEYFNELRAFLETTVQRSAGMIVYFA